MKNRPFISVVLDGTGKKSRRSAAVRKVVRKGEHDARTIRRRSLGGQSPASSRHFARRSRLLLTRAADNNRALANRLLFARCYTC